MSTTQTTDDDAFDPSLKDDLFAFEDATEGDIVRAEILGVEEVGSGHAKHIDITARLPTGNKFTHRVDYPKGNTSEYQFVRLAESLGYTIGSAEHMIGDTIECRYTDDDTWRILIPEPYTKRTKDAAGALWNTLLTPLWLVIGLRQTIEQDIMSDHIATWVMFGGFALAVWGTVLCAIVYTLIAAIVVVL